MFDEPLKKKIVFILNCSDVEKRYLKVVAELVSLEGTDVYAGDHIHVKSYVFEGQEQIDVVLCDESQT